MGHREVAFAVEFIEVSVELFELILQEGDVKSLELLEDLVGEDEIEAIDFLAPAGNKRRDEGLDLLEDTVAKRDLEFADHEVIEFLELLEHGLADRELADRVII